MIPGVLYPTPSSRNSTAALPAAEEVTIDIGGGFDQWDDEAITGVYRDYTNDTVDRDCRGYGDTYYKDTSGRNDIADAKVRPQRRTS